MKSKRVYIGLSETASELTITSAFIGATKNMYIIEEHFYALKHIPLNQYINYLSQLALCIELGLKNIIKITNKVWKSHDLEHLFLEADKETNSNFSKKLFGSNKSEFNQNYFLGLLKNIKFLYEESRYSYGNSLNYLFTEKYIVKNNILDFYEIINNKPIRILKLFLEELGEYHNFIHINSIKDNEYKELDSIISDIVKTKFQIQENIDIKEY